MKLGFVSDSLGGLPFEEVLLADVETPERHADCVRHLRCGVEQKYRLEEEGKERARAIPAEAAQREALRGEPLEAYDLLDNWDRT